MTKYSIIHVLTHLVIERHPVVNLFQVALTQPRHSFGLCSEALVVETTTSRGAVSDTMLLLLHINFVSGTLDITTSYSRHKRARRVFASEEVVTRARAIMLLALSDVIHASSYREQQRQGGISPCSRGSGRLRPGPMNLPLYLRSSSLVNTRVVSPAPGTKLRT